MIVLDFNLQGIESIYENLYKNLERADLSEIRYYLFQGKIIFKVNSSDFSPPFARIPIVDFCAGFIFVYRNLKRSDHEIFEFTEGEGEIFFDKLPDGYVKISCDYNQKEEIVSLLEVREEVKRFAERVRKRISQEYPRVLLNKDFLTLVESWRI